MRRSDYRLTSRRIAQLKELSRSIRSQKILLTGRNSKAKLASADFIAQNIQKSVYVVDLSQVVSKYIGETEKNLRQILDAAEQAGYILYFDEADALFGKRTDVRDSHERYDSVLEMICKYKIPLIFAAGYKREMDNAFLHKIKIYVRFPLKSLRS